MTLTIEILRFNLPGRGSGMAGGMSWEHYLKQYAVTDYEQTYARNVMLGSTSPPSKIKGEQPKSSPFICLADKLSRSFRCQAYLQCPASLCSVV